MSATSPIAPVSDSVANAIWAKRTLPVFYWAAVGLAFLMLVTYVMGSWIMSPDFHPAPVGPDPLPNNVWWAIRVVEVVGGASAIYTLAVYVLYPLFKKGGIGLDGILLLNMFLLWWADPIVNYVNYSVMYNSYVVNMGSWANHIPGWRYPNHGNFAEPFFMVMCGFYLGFFFLNTVFGCWLLRRMSARWPSMKTLWQLAVLFVGFCIIDTVVETALMQTGIAAYGGVVRSMTLFAGKAYQWPLYESAIIAFINIGFVCLRHFKNDKGLTFVERGIEQLKWTTGKRKLLTFFAVAGFTQPFFLIGYFVPYNLFAIQSDTFPAYPSYMRNMICGEGTKYACPSHEWVPIPGRDTKLIVAPDDLRLPKEVRDAQGITASGLDPYASK